MNPLFFFPSERVHRKFCSWHSQINTPVNNPAHCLKRSKQSCYASSLLLEQAWPVAALALQVSV